MAGKAGLSFRCLTADEVANGYRLTASRQASDDFVIGVAEGHEDLDTMAAWLRKHAEPA